MVGLRNQKNQQEILRLQLQAHTTQQITLFHRFLKNIFSYYCTVKLHVSAVCALPPLGSEAITFQ